MSEITVTKRQLQAQGFTRREAVLIQKKSKKGDTGIEFSDQDTLNAAIQEAKATKGSAKGKNNVAIKR